jgi:hypothetical protein
VAVTWRVDCNLSGFVNAISVMIKRYEKKNVHKEKLGERVLFSSVGIVINEKRVELNRYIGWKG